MLIFPRGQSSEYEPIGIPTRRTTAAEKTVVIVQARMRSTRLPAKVLLPLPTGRSVLHEVLERCNTIPDVHEVCVAVPDSDESAHLLRAIPAIATISHGPEEDVLMRYYRAAVATRADIIVRVTSDCPLIDPKLCHQVIQFRKKYGLAYAYNNQPIPGRPHRGTFPAGLDCEVFTINALRWFTENSEESMVREHVTWALRQQAVGAGYVMTNPAGDFGDYIKDPSLQWSLDTIDDYMRICDIFNVALGDVDSPATNNYYSMLERFRGEK